ncbi:MAG: acyl-CoA dehydrogenase family protein [Coxiellaceae bacterium]|nr:acyl-CoA dehydrogenase family protein [Coxiellaceae bacterium]
MPEFQLDDEQQQLQDTMIRFAENELRPIARACDDARQVPDELFTKMAELGLYAQFIPEAYGGYELPHSVVTGAIIAEELAWGDVGLAMAMLAPLSVILPVVQFGTDEQKQALLPAFCAEPMSHAAAALMEPDVNFDPRALQTTLTQTGDAFVLNGKKCYVPLADRAHHLLVYAQHETRGIVAVIVDAKQTGVSMSEQEYNMGLRTLPTFTVTFDNVKVTQEQLLGGEKGIDFERVLNHSRATQSALAVGLARSSYEFARDYAKERKAFGQFIAQKQAIAFMLAEMAMEIDAMRLLAWRASFELDQQRVATREATLAKQYCGEKCMTIVDYGIQVLGGHGYIRTNPVELWFRNGRAMAIVEGLAML